MGVRNDEKSRSHAIGWTGKSLPSGDVFCFFHETTHKEKERSRAFRLWTFCVCPIEETSPSAIGDKCTGGDHHTQREKGRDKRALRTQIEESHQIIAISTSLLR